MPKIDIAAVPARKGTGYPPPFDAPCITRTGSCTRMARPIPIHSGLHFVTPMIGPILDQWSARPSRGA
jgi:hypothetical protein